MPPLNLPQLEFGERVQHELRVVERKMKKQKDGSPFVILTLGNASGSIDTAPIWSNHLTWADGAERGAVVQAIGQVTTYRDNGRAKRQLELSAPLRIVPLETVSIEQFLPRIEEEPARLWEHIDRMRAEMRSATLRRVLDLFFADDAFRVQFERTPGSISRHHAKVGGLLLHVCEVAAIARTAAKAAHANVDLVTVGALLHDVGKVESYETIGAAFAYTPCGHLLGHVVLGCLMLERRARALEVPLCSDEQMLELQHLILSHHGALEFGSPVVPMTLEAELVHWADEASAKANDISESMADPDGFADGGAFSSSLWRVDRRRLWRRPHQWE
jgi:3'-5' exoribonuclease